MVSLSGYKTHIAAALIILAGVLYGLNVLDAKTLGTVITVLTGAGLSALRSGVSKNGIGL